MNTIFKSAEISKEFEENGYVVMDLFSSSDIEALKGIYTASSLSFDKHFYSSSFIEDMEIKQNISKEIVDILLPLVSQHFKNFKVLGSVFLVKPPGPESVMPVHQDWTVVDESKFSSITIWIPLQRTTVKNGAIKVLPKSHKLSNALRSPTLSDALTSVKDVCESDLIPLEMDIGQAFVFSHAVLHSSFPNLSDTSRIAVAFGLVHKDAELIFYHKVDGKVELLKISEDFFLNYPKPGERPVNSHLIRNIEYKETPVSIEDYNQFYGKKNNVQNKSLWNKLKQLFS